MMRDVRAELAKGAPDAAAVREKFASYFAIADETKAMMAKEPKSTNTEPYPGNFDFIVIEVMPKLKRSSDALLATMAEKPDPKHKERLDRDWDGVVSAYNELIRYMNQMQFDSKQK